MVDGLFRGIADVPTVFFRSSLDSGRDLYGLLSFGTWSKLKIDVSWWLVKLPDDRV